MVTAMAIGCHICSERCEKVGVMKGVLVLAFRVGSLCLNLKVKLINAGIINRRIAGAIGCQVLDGV